VDTVLSQLQRSIERVGGHCSEPFESGPQFRIVFVILSSGLFMFSKIVVNFQSRLYVLYSLSV
jgi:hypothetical protein